MACFIACWTSEATIVILANTNRTDLDAFAQRIGEWMLDGEDE